MLLHPDRPPAMTAPAPVHAAPLKKFLLPSFITVPFSAFIPTNRLRALGIFISQTSCYINIEFVFLTTAFSRENARKCAGRN
jgi:hypothetical protein